MADNDIEIRLKVIDEASEPIKTSITGIRGETDKLKVSTERTGTTMRDEFKKTNKDVREFRQSLMLVTAAFAAIIGSTREAAKYNSEAKETYDRFTKSISSLAATVGTALSPALEGVTVMVNVLRDTISAAIAGFIKSFSFITELFIGVKDGIMNVASNIKNFFTGQEDPVGIIQGFRDSFEKALLVADIATDQFLNKIETTRAAVESGRTIESESKRVQQEEQKKLEAIKKKETEEKALKTETYQTGKALLAQAAADNKSFAIANAAVSIVEAVVNTATGVTKALSMANIPLAAIIGAMGAAQVGIIASQKFAEGTDRVSKLAVGTDSVPAMLTPGEMVIPRTMSDAIRAGSLTLGGPGSSQQNVIEVNIFGGNFDSKQMVEQLAESIGFEIERKLLNVRQLT